MSKWNLEHTDTFGGEANYCWVNRAEIEAETDRAVIRAAKRFAGLTGQRCRTESCGDMIQITPIGRNAPCVTVFATWAE